MNQSDMKQYKNEHQHRKNTMVLVLKITVVALAVAIIATVVALAVTLLSGGVESSDEPVFEGEKEVVCYLGETISYRSFVTVSDGYTLEIDNSKVDPNTPGTYTVIYTAIDSDGNETEYTFRLKLIIKERDYAKEELMTLVAEKANALGLTKEMSKAELVRRIYAFANDPSAPANEANIFFSDVSNSPSQQNSRETWQTDWVEEATLTLKMSRMQGDCYTYYSVSKAFFEYFEIENFGIQRASSSTEPGTHFWNIVNVGTTEKPQWYYYDATRLAGSFSDGTKNGCLMTEAKLQSYRTSKGGTEFYLFTKWEGFPTISTKDPG